MSPYRHMCAVFRQPISIQYCFRWRDVFHKAESGLCSASGRAEMLQSYLTQISSGVCELNSPNLQICGALGQASERDWKCLGNNMGHHAAWCPIWKLRSAVPDVCLQASGGPKDNRQRSWFSKQFAIEMVSHNAEDKTYLNSLCFSDEATFHVWVGQSTSTVIM
jgi:hypothetical protein